MKLKAQSIILFFGSDRTLFFQLSILHHIVILFIKQNNETQKSKFKNIFSSETGMAQIHLCPKVAPIEVLACSTISMHNQTRLHWSQRSPKCYATECIAHHEQIMCPISTLIHKKMLTILIITIHSPSIITSEFFCALNWSQTNLTLKAMQRL